MNPFFKHYSHGSLYLKAFKNLKHKKNLFTPFLTLILIGAFGLIGCNKVSNFWNANTLFKGKNSSEIQGMPAQKLYTVQNNDLCAAYYGTMSPIIKEEISRRGLIDNDQWSDLNKNETWKGMTYCQIFAALGKPKGALIGDEFTELDYPNGKYQFLNGELTTYSQYKK